MYCIPLLEDRQQIAANMRFPLCDARPANSIILWHSICSDWFMGKAVLWRATLQPWICNGSRGCSPGYISTDHFQTPTLNLDLRATCRLWMMYANEFAETVERSDISLFPNYKQEQQPEIAARSFYSLKCGTRMYAGKCCHIIWVLHIFPWELKYAIAAIWHVVTSNIKPGFKECRRRLVQFQFPTNFKFAVLYSRIDTKIAWHSLNINTSSYLRKVRTKAKITSKDCNCEVI